MLDQAIGHRPQIEDPAGVIKHFLEHVERVATLSDARS
jgi:hypothetical protein